MATGNLFDLLLSELRLALSPLMALGEGGAPARLMAAATGWTLDPGTDPATDPQIAQLVSAYDALDALAAHPPQALADVPHLLSQLQQMFAAIGHVPVDPSSAGALGRDLAEGLLVGYLKFWHPPIYDALVLLTAIDPPGKLALDRLGPLVRDPVGVLRSAYIAPGGLVTAGDATALADRLFPRLADLAQHLGIDARYHPVPPAGTITPGAAPHVAGGVMTVFLQPNFEEPDRYVATIALSPRDLGDFGVAVIPTGTMAPYWDTLDLTAAVDGFAIGPNGLKFFGSASGFISKLLGIEVDGMMFGGATGTRLELGKLQVSAIVDLVADEHEYGAALDLGSSTLVLAPGDGDSFLASCLPSDGLRATFDLSAGWSNKKGFYFAGSGGLEVTIPVHATLGSAALHSVTLSVTTDGARLGVIAAASFGVHLGPFDLEIERFGARAEVAFDAPNSNLGSANLTVGISPPQGAGLTVGGSIVTGGGFLTHDPERGRYAGAVTLHVLDHDVTGFGVLDTKVPGSGYSLLIAIQARIPPIPLGFGFSLLGVGGILALNRKAALDVVRDNLRDGGLAHVLFPADPIGDFAQIVAEIDRIFPTAPGRFLIAPTAKIGWGTPALITADLALVMELPEPVRLAVLGVIRCVLPDGDSPLLKLQAAFIGTIDYSTAQLAFDASLFDSKLLAFSLDGDMSARLQLGLVPNYLFTVGGFHPAYTPPAMGLPVLRRITVNLLGGDNPRLRAEMYFARTSNSFQQGASIELYAAVSKFNIYGFLGYDGLVQIRPTKIAAAMKATLAVRYGDDPIMSVGLELDLEGPAPWHAKGSAHFSICWFLSFSVHFDRMWGKPSEVGEGQIDVLPLLAAAIRDPGSWHAPLPDGVHALVALRDVNDRLVDPAGALELRQTIVPLDLDIQRFSSLRPRDATRFAIKSVAHLGTALHIDPLDEEFAAAEFLDLSDADKLSRPAFERFHAGATITSAETLTADHVTECDVEYERIIIDRDLPRRRLDLFPLAPELLTALTAGSAIGRSVLARNARLVSRAQAVAVATETYAVVSSVDLAPASNQSLTYAEAAAELARLGTSFHIMSASELAA